MTDNEKWSDLINESFKYPKSLDNVEDRFSKRIKKEKRNKRAFISSLSAIAASLIFVLLVNTSTAFANVVAELPVIGKLAEYVKFDKSLSMAIENEYVQELNLVAWDEEKRLLLPYVIADEKNLVLFFQLPDEFKQESTQWVNIFLNSMEDSTTGEKVEGYSYSTSGLSAKSREQNHGFIMHEYHFSEGTLPKSIDIEVEMKIENILGEEEPVELSKYDNYFTPIPYLENAGTYSFHIELDEFQEPKIYHINETHTVMGQKIIVESMLVYPTGTEVNFSFPNENTAWIKGIELEVLQDEVVVYKGNNGISSTNDLENKKMSVFIESNYFDKPKKQELFIKAVRLLDKNEEYITVDIDSKIITPQIKGTELKQVIKNNGTATLVFSTKIENDDNHGMFEYEYRDTNGNTYNLNGEGTSSSDQQMETIITVKYPKGGKVILKRTLTPKVYLENPISIDIK